MKKLQLPSIHVNGTSKARLIEDICEASQALDVAYEAMKRTGPNGRDYYTQGPDALASATDQHTARLRLIDAVKQEMDALAVGIERGGHGV